MKKNRRADAVEVVVDLDRLGGMRRMGLLHRQAGGGGDIFSFEYDERWLKQPEVFQFDPDLQLVKGKLYPPPGRENFGIFMDSSPDRWGRLLMDRRAARRAAKEGNPPPKLGPWDYLLGVHDSTRLGAIRFRRSEKEPFLDDDKELAAPPIARVRQLQAVSIKLEDEHAEEHPDYDQWLAQLVAPGSSLGGARPKAAVIDDKGRLCIAKFPSRKDTRDVGAWEYLLHILAAAAGIQVSHASVQRFGNEGQTFITRRFDRTETRGRRAFISAMTLLQRQDGEPGTSYLELVELLQSRGADTRADCEQLFRRVVFNICTSNTDDHLRNHGFFVERNGLLLSPAYDMNPNPERRDLSLAIDEANTACDVDVALRAAPSYGLSAARGASIVTEVRTAVRNWHQEATSIGIAKDEQYEMQSAFR